MTSVLPEGISPGIACLIIELALGAIAGDIIGSVHEGRGTKTKDFPLFVLRSRFTDDSILTIAIAEWILTGKDLADLLHGYANAHPADTEQILRLG
jgi:ADP-ribosylglycohydrolase